jgi:glycosyltransferase involved in cell wall biosynthesis
VKAVVIQRGARDAYQIASALAERGLLDRLVTDLYWPADRSGAQELERVLPKSAIAMLHARFTRQVPSNLVSNCWFSGMMSFLLERSHRFPYPLRRAATRWCDSNIGKCGGRLAMNRESVPFSYSYYGYQAFRLCPNPGILFQLHPHPASVRRILRAELSDHPEAASSLLQEWELGLPEEDYRQLSEEPAMAHTIVAASSFTRETLIENGVPRHRVHVAPYGVDHERFRADPKGDRSGTQHSPLRLLFVGRLCQRKGLTYLIDAIREFRPGTVEVVVAGRPVGDLHIFDSVRDRIQLRRSVSDAEIRDLYRGSDLLVLPSLAEGFGHVLLEALASGLPILATTHTAGPDLITSGVEGWIVSPKRADLVSERIEWALRNRAALAAMRKPAYECSRRFTWSRFRARIAEIFEEFVQARQLSREEALTRV